MTPISEAIAECLEKLAGAVHEARKETP